MAGGSILLVEDEDVIRRILTALLREKGHEVVEAPHGEAALELLGEREFDLLMADKNLPGISGLELMRQARTMRPALQMMMITGYASYDSVLEALRLGAREFLEKPFLDITAIQARVQAVVDEALLRKKPSWLAGQLVQVLERQPQNSDVLAAARDLHARLRAREP